MDTAAHLVKAEKAPTDNRLGVVTRHETVAVKRVQAGGMAAEYVVGGGIGHGRRLLTSILRFGRSQLIVQITVPN
jgi:plasmid replication initiation protein